jgi:hypothetical protein
MLGEESFNPFNVYIVYRSVGFKNAIFQSKRPHTKIVGGLVYDDRITVLI